MNDKEKFELLLPKIKSEINFLIDKNISLNKIYILFDRKYKNFIIKNKINTLFGVKVLIRSDMSYLWTENNEDFYVECEE